MKEIYLKKYLYLFLLFFPSNPSSDVLLPEAPVALASATQLLMAATPAFVRLPGKCRTVLGVHMSWMRGVTVLGKI